MSLTAGVDVDGHELQTWVAMGYLGAWHESHRAEGPGLDACLPRARALLTPDVLASSLVAIEEGSVLAVATVSTDWTTEIIVHTLLSADGAAPEPHAVERAVAQITTAVRVPWTTLRILAPWSWRSTMDPIMAWRVPYVRKRLRREPVPDSSIEVSPMHDSDRGFVVGLMARAVLNGVPPAERARWPRGLEPQDIATRRLRSIERERPCIRIARDPGDGDRLGHALAQATSTEHLGADVEATLHDVFVLPTATGRGVSRALSADVEHHMTELGFRFLLSSAVAHDKDNQTRLLETLAVRGWRASYAVWTRLAPTG